MTLKGKRYIQGRIVIPYWGTWTADLVLADPIKIEGASALVLGNLEMQGFSRTGRSVVYAGKSAARVVGGKAGAWNKVISPKGYSHAAGVKLKTLLQDAARACGEEIVVANDKTVGTLWGRKSMRASSVLKLLIDGEWWMGIDGVTQTSDRVTTKISSQFTILDYKPNLGQFEIATESYKDWMPGRKFSAPTLDVEHSISSVTFTIGDGKVRVTVLTDETPHERLLKEIRAIIRDEVMRLEYGSIVQYEITKAEEQKISCKPAAGADSPWPSLKDVPLKSSLMGEVVTPTEGKKCLILFMDDDPALYRCIGVEGPNAKNTWETSGNTEIACGGTFIVNGGSNFAALANLVNTNFETLATKFTAHVHGTGVGPTTPPTVPLVAASDFPSVACTKFKTL